MYLNSETKIKTPEGQTEIGKTKHVNIEFHKSHLLDGLNNLTLKTFFFQLNGFVFRKIISLYLV